MEKLSASIVVYNTDVFLLKRAMTSFLASSIAGELVIVDNSPADNLRQFCEGIKNVSYIFNGRNLGYGAAHNIAIRSFIDRSSYHLVLNPDVYFDAGTLEKIFYFMEAHPLAGLAMPKVYNAHHELQMSCKLLPTPFNLAIRRFFLSHGWLDSFNDRYEMRERGYQHVMNVPFLSGCFMFLRTSALKKTGLFDERFFLYAEDTDLSRRIHRQFETLFFPGAEITHLHARGSYKDLRLTLQNLKSAIQYFNKWGWFFDAERKLINARALSQTSTISPEKTSLEKIKVA
jgi:hypothetical protein